jgi:hypothetical protein
MLIGVGIMFFKMPTLQGRKIPLQWGAIQLHYKNPPSALHSAESSPLLIVQLENFPFSPNICDLGCSLPFNTKEQGICNRFLSSAHTPGLAYGAHPRHTYLTKFVICDPLSSMQGGFIKKESKWISSNKVSRKVRRSGGENGQFRHNRASNA